MVVFCLHRVKIYVGKDGCFFCLLIYIYIYIYIYICVEILRNNKFHYIRVDKKIYKYVIFNIIYIEYM